MKEKFTKLTMTLASALLLATPVWAATAIVHKSPKCSCCENYVQYLKAQGFDVTAMTAEHMTKLGKKYQVPKTGGKSNIPFALCHLTTIGNYVVAGHVPAKTIERLLREQPDDISGIILPGMPPGSPGMAGEKSGPFVIYAFDDNGRSWVYARI